MTTPSTVPLHPTPTPSSIPIPSATHILLTQIPPFLRNPRNLRHFLSTTAGHAKHISYSCPIRRSSQNDGGDDNSNDKSIDDEHRHIAAAVVKLHHASQAMSLVRNWEKARKILQSPMNAFVWYQDGTLPALYPERSEVDKRMLESLWETLYGERGEDEVGQTARLADENFVAKLVESYRSNEHWENQEEQKDMEARAEEGAVAAVGVGVGTNGLNGGETVGVSATTNPTVVPATKLDRAKVAAAAGGTYDEEADPLNAPEVLEAVAQFKKKLEAAQGGNRKRRAEYVNRRLQEEKIKAKERLLEKRKQENGIGVGLLPPPPPPPVLLPPPPPLPTLVPGGVPPPRMPLGEGGVPLPIGLVPPPPPPPHTLVPPPLSSSIAVSGVGEKRTLGENVDEDAGGATKIPKISNDHVHGEIDVMARKERLDVGNASVAEIREANIAADKAAQYLKEAVSFTKEDILSDKHFPALVDEHYPTVRKYVKDQIIDYLGEEEATLIDFVVNYLKKEEKERGTLALLEEMKLVLEEDGEAFVVDLFRKVVEICSDS